MRHIVIVMIFIVLPCEANQGCSPYDVPLTASLPDSNFNASSVLSANLNQPYMAKLHGSKEWCPATAATDEFIQVDWSTPYRVCAIDTQGHHTLPAWFVSSYKVAYSLNGSTWFIAQQNETNLIFPGNTNGNIVARNGLNDNSSFVARYLRIFPLTWNTWPCMRIEVFGRELPSLDTNYPRNKTVLEGQQFTLLCFPLGNVSKFNVSWVKRTGSDTSYPVSTGNLTINASRFDSGEYNCMVTNGVEIVISPTAYVDVLYPPSLDAIYPSDHTVVEGTNLTLQCRVTAANPKPNITWYNVSGNDNTSISFGENLTFTSIQRIDAGSYLCVVKNGIGNTAISRISAVDVQYQPSLNAMYPRDHTVVEGTNLILQCRVTAANPKPNITWYNVSANDNTSIFFGENLTFTNIRRADAGSYRCVVENGIGKAAISRISTVDVQYPPMLDEGYPSKHTVVEGVNLTLQCRVTAANPEPNITWYSGNNTVLWYGVTLTFSRISRSAAGQYYCVVGNEIGHVTSRISSIDVQYPPSLNDVFPRNHTIVEGVNLPLQCRVTAANPEPNITWYSGNNTVLWYGVTLTFSRISRSAAGQYYCVAGNGIGHVTSRISSIDVQYPPSLNDVFPRNHTVVEGVNLTLQCRVTAANPEPNITWYSGNNTVLWYRVTLTFSRISRSAAGQYYCVVGNGIGHVTSRISSIDVQYPPSLNDVYPRNHTIIEGVNLTLQCKVTAANPEPNITWYSGNNTVLWYGVTLTFSRISRSAAGQYYCVVGNGIGHVTSRISSVDVQYPPSLDVVYPRNHTIVEGVNLTLQCKVTAANPEPNITWYSGNNTVLWYGVTLTFSRISRSAAGQYYCVAGNGIGHVASRISSIDVQYLPSLDVNYPQDHTIVEGENLTLQCKVTAANPKPNITWYSVTGNSTVLSNGAKLTLTNILRTSAGKYYCVARNGISGSVVSRNSVINVLYPPILDPNYPRDHSINEGDTLSLQCVVKESNPFPNITWTKLSDPGKVLSSDVNLNLRNMAHDDEGEYRCLVDNGIGGQIWSRVASVNVQRRNRGSTEEGENEAQKSKGRGLIITLLIAAIAIFTTGILLLLIFCVCVHKTSGLSPAVKQPRNVLTGSADYLNLDY